MVSVGPVNLTQHNPQLAFGATEAAEPRLRRPQLLERILALNPTAAPEFLAAFSDDALADYLDHLQLTAEPRDAKAAWVRKHRAPGIVHREAPE